MGHDLVLIIPFADSDPSPFYAKGAFEMPTSVHDAVNLIALVTEGEDVSNLPALCPDPVECSKMFAPSLLETQGIPLSPDAILKAEGEIKSQMEVWPGLTLKAFGLAASVPTLLWDDQEPLVSNNDIDPETLLSNPASVVQYLRIAIKSDDSRDNVLLENGEHNKLEVPDIVIHPDGGLGLLDEEEGVRIVQPIKVECTTLYSSSSAGD